jgi:hypothetical protein
VSLAVVAGGGVYAELRMGGCRDAAVVMTGGRRRSGRRRTDRGWWCGEAVVT